MTFDEYRAIPALNWSTLKNMAVSPLYYGHRLAHPRPDTPALAMGRAIHAAILEPEAFAERYRTAEQQQCEATTKTGSRCSKNAVLGSTLCAQHGGVVDVDPNVTTLSVAEGETIARCAGAVASHTAARELLARATEREVTVEWEINGRRMKGRIDALGSDNHGDIVVDLKTTRSLARFQRQAGEMMYHAQLAMYRHGAIAAGRVAPDVSVYIVAVESVEPWDVGVFHLDEETLEDGRHTYRRFLRELQACEDMGYWPGAYPGVTDLDLPPWSRALDEEEEL